jgi:acetolactate synthase-1/2/3 large subunit
MNKEAQRPRTGGQLVVDALLAHGVERVFCVPGESYLAVLDALYDVRDRIDVVTCRHESGAAFMAEAYAKLTGKPGICFVTRGPGACNASIGVHTAFQDSTPLVLFVGQVARDQFDREAFQEVDYRLFFRPLAKWCTQIEMAERVPELVSQAFSRASSGRRGPCVVALPEDMLVEVVPAPTSCRPARTHPSPTCTADDIDAAARLLQQAARPLLVVGGGGWTEADGENLTAAASALGVPVACTFRRQDLLDNDHPCYAGDLGYGLSPELARIVKESDLIIAVGTRLGEVATQAYTLLKPPVPDQALIHVYPDASELGRVYAPTIPILSKPGPFLEGLAGASITPSWGEWRAHARTAYEKSFQAQRPSVGDVHMPELIRILSAVLPADAIICTGAGNYTGWVHRYFKFRSRGTLLGPTNGAMGYGVPAAVAAKITYPDRVVIGFAGDGCFMMTAQELATAASRKSRPVFIVINNGIYGTIRAHQERAYPGRSLGTDLHNPDFVTFARSFGFDGHLVERTEQFAAALSAALQAPAGALIEVRVHPEDVSTRATLSQIRSAGEASRA